MSGHHCSRKIIAQRTLELRASEARFRNIVSISSDGIFIVDGMGVIRFVNPAAEILFGRKAGELLGQHFGFPTVSGETTEIDIIRKEGGSTVAEMRVVVTEWEGAPAYLATLRDVTERQRAEHELRKLYRAISQSPSMVIITDAEGAIEFVNPKFSETTGYLQAEVVGQTPRILKSGKTPPEAYVELWRAITSGREWHGEFINRKKNGELYHEAASVAPVTDADGTITHFVAVMDDITERKQVEDALRKSEALFRVIFDQAFQLMGLMQPDGTLIKVNRTAAGFLEAEEEEVLGKLFWNTPWWSHSPEQQARLQEAVKRAAKGEFVRFEATHMTPEGELAWIDFSLKPVMDENGKAIFLVPEGRDVTTYKRAQAQIESLNADLAARATELESANRELEAFNYMVAHDLRQPLNLLGMYWQTLNMLCGDQFQGECAEYLQQASQVTSRMNGIIEALLGFSRLGHLEPRCETVDLSALAREVARMLKLAEPGRQVDFRVSDGIVANADANLLRVVLNNLLGNALKYTGKQEEAVIEFGSTEIDGVATYFVRDNGAGFDMRDADNLFIPFKRLPGAEHFKGFGIGLATVARIISRHGGRVWAEGEPGKGATFYFTLRGDRNI
jgi:PAS domain S-box-containing protein